MRAKEEDYEVYRSPFGWYKGFDLKAKGHPLSEWSREIHIAEPSEEAEEIEPEALLKEKELHSQWFVLTPQGELVKAADFDYSAHPELAAFYKY